jgi:hypothetical protein
VFLEQTAILDTLNMVGPRGASVGQGHLPLPHPEIKTFILPGTTGTIGGVLSMECWERYHKQKNGVVESLHGHGLLIRFRMYFNKGDGRLNAQGSKNCQIGKIGGQKHPSL